MLLVVDPKKGADPTPSTRVAPRRAWQPEGRPNPGIASSALVAGQNRLWPTQAQSLLIVLQAIDAGGKDGTIRKVFEGVNPQGCKVTSFKAPVGEELEHDFLWRVHRAAPAARARSASSIDRITRKC